MEEVKPYANFTLEDGTQLPLTEEEFWAIYSGKRIHDMPKELFKHIQKEINEAVKNKKKGTMVHVSKLSGRAWENLVMKSEKYKGVIPKQKGVTYKKS